MRFKVLLFLVANLIAFRLSYAVTHTNDSLAEYRPIPYTQKDRDLLIKLDERTKYLEQLINERTNYLNERIDNLQKQIDDLREDMKWQFGVLFTLIVALFGFIIWDRRTFMKPLEEKVISLNEETKNIKEKVQLNERLLQALRELSLKDEKLREILKQFNLL
ncbi:MAG: hemolysin XhlA family protein [Bacteroidia bacterium]|nr:hemolysin XhlA family protein [Bacteroidia bacterium]